jgi:hypothetical protein
LKVMSCFVAARNEGSLKGGITKGGVVDLYIYTCSRCECSWCCAKPYAFSSKTTDTRLQAIPG